MFEFLVCSHLRVVQRVPRFSGTQRRSVFSVFLGGGVVARTFAWRRLSVRDGLALVLFVMQAGPRRFRHKADNFCKKINEKNLCVAAYCSSMPNQARKDRRTITERDQSAAPMRRGSPRDFWSQEGGLVGARAEVERATTIIERQVTSDSILARPSARRVQSGPKHNARCAQLHFLSGYPSRVE